MAPYTKIPAVSVCVSADNHVYLLNGGSDEVVLEAGELFGFNLGSWKELALGPWVLKRVKRL